MKKVSVIIPVKEINDYVREAVKFFKVQDFTSFEVIVFPDHDTGAALEGVRVIATGPMGPGEKRDLALKYAEGEILAFIDDDAYPRSDWLRRACAHFDDVRVAAVGGPAVTPQGDSTARKASGAVFASWFTSSRYTYRYRRGKMQDVDDMPTVNLFVRRSVFERLGGFDTSCWPGEDTKLCLDIVKKLGMRIVYDPDVLVYHHRRPLFLDHLRQVSRYACQRGYFVKAFPQTSLRPGYFIPSVFVLFILSGLVAPLYPAALMPWVCVMAVYGTLLVAATFSAIVSERDMLAGCMAAPGMFLTHIVYGLFFLKGLLSARKGIDAAALAAE